MTTVKWTLKLIPSQIILQAPHLSRPALCVMKIVVHLDAQAIVVKTELLKDIIVQAESNVHFHGLLHGERKTLTLWLTHHIHPSPPLVQKPTA